MICGGCCAMVGSERCMESAERWVIDVAWYVRGEGW